ncbi:MAG: hypothetical protein GY925_23410 [Actinomycetia bacterium]|nr:hypothetical protein [Actinomycetes bacterium]
MTSGIRWTLWLVFLTFMNDAPAQALTIGLPASDTNRYPFSGCIFGQACNHYQQVYDQDEFPGPITITGISFQGGTGVLASGTYSLSLSTTQAPVDALDTTDFGSNLGADNSVFSVRVLTGGLAPSVLSFFGTPFHYDPSDGNLLLDIAVTGFVEGTATYLAHNGSAAGVFSRAHNFGTFGYEGYGLVTTFVPEPDVPLLLIATLLGASARRTNLSPPRRRVA